MKPAAAGHRGYVISCLVVGPSLPVNKRRHAVEGAHVANHGRRGSGAAAAVTKCNAVLARLVSDKAIFRKKVARVLCGKVNQKLCAARRWRCPATAVFHKWAGARAWLVPSVTGSPNVFPCHATWFVDPLQSSAAAGISGAPLPAEERILAFNVRPVSGAIEQNTHLFKKHIFLHMTIKKTCHGSSTASHLERFPVFPGCVRGVLRGSRI